MEPDDYDRNRKQKRRFVGAIAMSCLLPYFIASDVPSFAASCWVTMASAIYMLIGGIAMVALLGRLYGKHEFSKPVFDIYSLLLIMVLIALPLGFGNFVLRSMGESTSVWSGSRKINVQIFYTGMAICLYLPTLFIADFCLAFLVRILSEKRLEDE